VSGQPDLNRADLSVQLQVDDLAPFEVEQLRPVELPRLPGKVVDTKVWFTLAHQLLFLSCFDSAMSAGISRHVTQCRFFIFGVLYVTRIELAG